MADINVEILSGHIVVVDMQRGFSGYSGRSGFSGYSGANPGASGYSGYSGKSGYSGISGKSGYSGASGFSGYSGRSAYSGYSGASGFSGYSGTSGFSGYSGKSGYSGISGFSGVRGVWARSTVGATVAGSSTVYDTFEVVTASSAGATFSFNATENLKQIIVPNALTLSNFYVVTSDTQPNDGALVFTVRDNGADTGIVVTVAANAAAGTFSDTTHTAAISAGHLLSFSVANASSSTSATTIRWAISYN